jgi:Domain of unknown function (DUF4113)
MGITDQINAGTLKLASESFKQPWRMKQGNKKAITQQIGMS